MSTLPTLVEPESFRRHAQSELEHLLQRTKRISELPDQATFQAAAEIELRHLMAREERIGRTSLQSFVAESKAELQRLMEADTDMPEPQQTEEVLPTSQSSNTNPSPAHANEEIARLQTKNAQLHAQIRVLELQIAQLKSNYNDQLSIFRLGGFSDNYRSTLLRSLYGSNTSLRDYLDRLGLTPDPDDASKGRQDSSTGARDSDKQPSKTRKRPQ